MRLGTRSSTSRKGLPSKQKKEAITEYNTDWPGQCRVFCIARIIPSCAIQNVPASSTQRLRAMWAAATAASSTAIATGGSFPQARESSHRATYPGAADSHVFRLIGFAVGIGAGQSVLVGHSGQCGISRADEPILSCAPPQLKAEYLRGPFHAILCQNHTCHFNLPHLNKSDPSHFPP